MGNDRHSYIKLQTHETMKTRAYKEAIGKHYNMSYKIDDDTDMHYYEYHDERKLEHIHTESHENIESESGIINRQIRSIQTERHFGDIKENTMHSISAPDFYSPNNN